MQLKKKGDQPQVQEEHPVQGRPWEEQDVIASKEADNS